MSLRIVLAVAMALWLATPARAQDVSATIFAGAAVADWSTTYYNLTQKHNGERNPSLGWLAPHPRALVTLGAAMDVAGTVAWWRLTERHRRLRTAGFLAATGFRLYLVRHNLRTPVDPRWATVRQ